MTMIACLSNTVAPMILGGLLISTTDNVESFDLPTISEDVIPYLEDTAEYHPLCLTQKSYILRPNLCIGFAGKPFYFKMFLEDLEVFCKYNEVINAEVLEKYLNEYDKESWKHFSFVMLIVDRKFDHFTVGKITHGEGLNGLTPIFGEITALGSGAESFLRESVSVSDLLLSSNLHAVGKVVYGTVIMAARLLATERAVLNSVKEHWGAGFELIYFDGGSFKKLDNITYVISQGEFDNEGNIDLLIPTIVLHYKYHKERLFITVVRPLNGETKSEGSTYITRYKSFTMRPFIVSPLDYQADEPEQLANYPSFRNNNVAMGYIIETTGGFFVPGSFHQGEDVEVVYEHPHALVIKVRKEVNETIIREAKKVFPNL